MKGLTKEQLEKLDEWVDEMDVDVTELPSYHYDADPYGVGRELRGWSGCYVWDEDEWMERAIEEAVEKLEADGWDAYFDYDEDQNPEELTKEAIEYLKGM